MDFLDFVRKQAEESKERFIQKAKGPGRGWWAPPKGTHTAGAKAKGGGATSKDLRRMTSEQRMDHVESRGWGIDSGGDWGVVTESRKIGNVEVKLEIGGDKMEISGFSRRGRGDWKETALDRVPTPNEMAKR